MASDTPTAEDELEPLRDLFVKWVDGPLHPFDLNTAGDGDHRFVKIAWGCARDSGSVDGSTTYDLNATGRLLARALGCVRLEGRCECGLCEYIDSWQAKCDYGYDWPGCRDCFARLDADGWATLSPLYMAKEGATDGS